MKHISYRKVWAESSEVGLKGAFKKKLKINKQEPFKQPKTLRQLNIYVVRPPTLQSANTDNLKGRRCLFRPVFMTTFPCELCTCTV